MSNNKSKLTLIVDGNWLLMSRMAKIYSRFKEPQQFSDELKLLMTRSIKIVLKQFPEIDNIFFVADGGSWRTTIEQPKCLIDEEVETEYKANRVKSDDFDWDLIFGAFEEFRELLANNNINTFRENGLEGDDWCWYLSNYLNANGTNVIIWSRDKDLTQLVHSNDNGCFTVCWSKESGLQTDKMLNESMDFFFNFSYDTNSDLFNTICEHAQAVSIIKPNEVVVDKIIRGDLGDNVFPIMQKTSPSGKKFRIAMKDIDTSLDCHSETSIKQFITNTLNSKKYIGKINKSPEDIYEHFIYNRQMVELRRDNYPQEIKDIMKNYKDFVPNKDILKIESILTAKVNNIEDVLEEI